MPSIFMALQGIGRIKQNHNYNWKWQYFCKFLFHFILSFWGRGEGASEWTTIIFPQWGALIQKNNTVSIMNSWFCENINSWFPLSLSNSKSIPNTDGFHLLLPCPIYTHSWLPRVAANFREDSTFWKSSCWMTALPLEREVISVLRVLFL